MFPPKGKNFYHCYLHHHLYSFKVPTGETYQAVESPRGEIGCYMVSDSSPKPLRMHVRGPSFYNLQSMVPMMRGRYFADAVAVISSVDPIMGEVDTFGSRPRWIFE